MLTFRSQPAVAPEVGQTFQPQLQPVSNSEVMPTINAYQGSSIEIGQSSGSRENPSVESSQSLRNLSLEENVNPTTVSCRNRKKGRGKYKSKSLLAKTKGGRKLTIKIPDDIVRAVGPAARDIVNYSGLVMRTVVSFRNGNWKDIGSEQKKAMWLKVKDEFEISGIEREGLLEEFVTDTMQRLFRAWKARLRAHYSRYSNDIDRLDDRPEDVHIDEWKYLVKHFGTPAFKAASERNKKNRGKHITKHTCGTKSFAEVEESTRDHVTGEKKPVDELWEIQHTHKDDQGEVVWADPKSQQIHDQLMELVTQQKSDETVQPMTGDEILLSTLGARSGFFRGKGYGKEAPKKRRRHQANIE